jgi:hypothetical protein
MDLTLPLLQYHRHQMPAVLAEASVEEDPGIWYDATTAWSGVARCSGEAIRGVMALPAAWTGGSPASSGVRSVVVRVSLCVVGTGPARRDEHTLSDSARASTVRRDAVGRLKAPYK